MPAHSLREIEKTLATLWLDSEARQGFLKSKKQSLNPDSIQSEIDKKGVRLYGALLSHGRQDLMLSIFPHCARLLGNNWQLVVEDYYAKFPPNHYNLNRAAQRFSAYLTEHGQKFHKRFPFLAELADYEWLELELLEFDLPVNVQPNALLNSAESFTRFSPLINPVLTVRAYEYPITKIVDQLTSSKRLPRNVAACKTYVAVFRDPVTNKCRFTEVGEVAAALIQAAREANLSFADLIALAVSRTPKVDPQIVVADFLELIEKLQEMRLIIGSNELST